MKFHAEFENEGPRASFFDFDVVFYSFYIKNSLEHCFVTNWARFRFYPTKIPPFEQEFHAEFENEGPGALFFDFDVLFDYFYIKKGWNNVFSPIGHGLGFIQRKYHHSNRNFTLNSKMKVPGLDSSILMSCSTFFI